MVFYGVAGAYQPGDPTGTIPLPGPVSAGGPCGSCLTVDPPSAASDKHVVVVVAGTRLTTQGARPSTNAVDYLEGENNSDNAVYAKWPKSATFNDTVVFK